ncbi:MAG: lytic transglycosylase domain-containing protein, partial [Acidimicrobiia bacterium]|nr:lytic transglycosylase domain-containing protein [Acidimicrobiia bacterium]
AAMAVGTALLAAACSSGTGATAADRAGATPPPTGPSGAVDAGTGSPTATAAPAPPPTAPTGAVPASAPTTAPDAAPVPDSPQALAVELTRVETELGRADLTEAGAAPWGRRQQVLYLVLSSNPGWAPEVTAAVGEAVRPVVELNWEARRNLSALVNSEKLADTVPAWDIGAPRPADELLGYYREAAEATGVPWEVLAAINLVESRMGRIRGLSTAGAVGPMQFLPSTWSGCCAGDPTVDRDAIIGAATYLKQRGALTDLDRAIHGYNNSDHYVRAVRAYADTLVTAPGRYYGYHAWEVLFLSSVGLLRIPQGYHQAEPVDAATWLSQHPDAFVAEHA